MRYAAAMAGNEYFPVRPKDHASIDGPELRTRVLAGSSLAVQGIFIEALRSYFSGPDAPFRWNTDANSSEIIIEASRNPQVEVNNPSRAVYITRQRSTPQQLMLGNRVGTRLRDGQESFAAHMGMSIRVECVSSTPGDCELLSDFVFNFLIASAGVFEKMYGFHKVALPSLGEIVPYQADTQMFMGPIDFDTTHQTMWTSVPIAPLLEQMQVNILTRNGRAPQPGAPGWDAEQAILAAFTETAVRSLDRAVPAMQGQTPPPDRT